MRVAHHQPRAGPQHTRDLVQRGRNVGQIFKHLQRNRTVDRSRGERQGLGRPVDDLDIVALGAAPGRRRAHLGAGLDPDRPALRADRARQFQGQQAGSGADIDHGIARTRRQRLKAGQAPPDDIRALIGILEKSGGRRVELKHGA